MNSRYSDISRTRSFNRGEKIVFIMMLLIVLVCIFIPVWQAGENRSLSMKLQKSQQTMAMLEEQQRTLQARVAKARMPESLTGNAIRQEMVFTRIAPTVAARIAATPAAILDE